jgi:hypothetical protein
MNARSFQAMVPMRDGMRLNTFVFLPNDGRLRWPVIVHRTPCGIAAANAPHKFDHTHAWLPNPAEPMRGSKLEVAASLDFSHFHQPGWKSFSAATWKSGKPPFPHVNHFHPYGGQACPGHGWPEPAVGAQSGRGDVVRVAAISE